MEKAQEAPWHTLEARAAAGRLGVDPSRGLSSEEAARRLREQGPNLLDDRGGRRPLLIFFQQFTSLMVLLLIGAAAVSGLVLAEWRDALVILVIVVLNAVLGFWQEYRAERALQALRRLSLPVVRVLREGKVREIASRDLVPGDIVLLEAGNFVPADCRLLESANLKAQEAALTGEAEPVEKQAEAIVEPELPLGDRRNLLYMGTAVTYGRGSAMVTATGMRTELGRIAILLQKTDGEKTVLQRKLASLSLVLVFAALALIGVVSLEGWLLENRQLKDIFLTAVSMAVAAIPEGLPAVVTIALALGAQRMLRRNALVRKLTAVETLGSVTVICSDKTGTLTQNRMSVALLDLPGRRLQLETEGEAPSSAGETLREDSAAWLLLAGGALCSDAVLDPDSAEHRTIGDPTEGALVAAAARQRLAKPELERILPRRDELPFDSQRKRMTTLHALSRLLNIAEGDEGSRSAAAAEAAQLLPPVAPPSVLLRWLQQRRARALAFTKGAVDSLLEVSTAVWLPEGVEPLDEAWQERIRRANETLAAEGIRVLGLALRDYDSETPQREELEQELVFVGLAGLLDPLRPQAKEAVETCRHAGIRPVMITGDHPLIARTIASGLGMPEAERVLTGRDLERLSEEELDREVLQISVYARVAPEHKLRIVDALQRGGEIVAMTGDGVNDAPALKSADIGVAMGITGTDVAKEASDMVLQDDNFATIVAAVEEGRIIFDNILRFVRYILSSNWAEILVMLVGPLLGLPIPLLPVQILWMNLVTDGLPALALGVEPGEKGVMDRPPRPPRKPLFDWPAALHVLLVGVLLAALSLATGLIEYRGAGASAASTGARGATLGQEAAATAVHAAAPSAWRTMLFTTLVLSQLTLALAERSQHRSIFRIGLFGNRAMVGALGLTLVLQLAVVYVPVLQLFFSTTSLTLPQLALCLLASLAVLLVMEIQKGARWGLRRLR
jgi:Ca2+-transporting ATPase